MARADANLKIGADTTQASAAIKKLNRDLAGVKLDSLINLGSRAKDAGSSLIKLVGGFQQVQLTLDKVTGGNGYAKFNELSTIAGKTQFDVLTLSEAFTKLETAGVAGATDKLSQFADIAAVTTDNMGTLQAITDLFARTTQGGLGLEDLNRLGDRGIPVWRILGEQMGLTRLQISKYGQSAEGAGEITETLLAVLSSKYSGAAAEQANTVAVAWDNAGMKAGELIAKISEESGVAGGFTWLAKKVGEAVDALDEYLYAQDRVLQIKALPIEARIVTARKEIAKMTADIQTMRATMEKHSDPRLGGLISDMILEQREAVAKLSQLYLKDVANFKKSEEAKARAYSTKRKATISSAFDSAFGGDDSTSSELVDANAKKKIDALNKLEKDGLIVGEALRFKVLQARSAIELTRLIEQQKVKTQLRKQWAEQDQQMLLNNLTQEQDGLLTAVEYTVRVNEQKNELLDRIAEARMQKVLLRFDFEKQALIRKHDFEIKLEEETARRKQKLREVEFRNKGFSTDSSKKMASDEAEYNKKTQSEKAQWAIQQGATALDALGQHSRKAFELAKAFNIANAIMNTMTGVTKALAQGGVFGLITGAVVLAAGLANVATIRSQQYQGRQFGGTVTGNKPYMVGEKGPELFVPGKTGSVVNNGELQNGGTTNITFEINAVDASGIDELIAERQDMIIGMIRNAHEDAGYDARL